MSILHRVAPIKVYLTIYHNLKNTYLKKSFRRINKAFWVTSIKSQLKGRQWPGIKVGLQLY